MTTARTIVAVACVMALATPALAVEDPGTTDAEDPMKGITLPLAGAFGLDPEDLAALHEEGLGYGQLFKMSLYAAATGLAFEEILALATIDPETGEMEFSWGTLWAGLTDEERAALGDLPRNLGQIVSEAKRHHGRDAHRPDHAVGHDDGEGDDGGDDPEPVAAERGNGKGKGKGRGGRNG